jgi:cellulose synthase/poly-beta-1,6-N-acetylglucosamine synthase-like glycosyltransferase
VAQRRGHDSQAVLHGVSGAEAETYRARARRLGLSFASHVHLGPDAVNHPDAISIGKAAKSMAGELFIAPDEETMPETIGWLNAYPAARRQISVSTPTAIRAGLRAAGARDFLKDAIARVEAVEPACSARQRLTHTQRAAGATCTGILAVAAILVPLATFTLVEVAAATFFILVAVLRLIAATYVPSRPLPAPPTPTGPDVPVYTILVPLRHEAHMVRQLLHGLDRLAWARERLDIKLIIDEDDASTLAAARALAREPPYEIVVVPPGGPRTKPMALQYALSFARGEFVTVYDAEDRPHPGQLAEAFTIFREAPQQLACLQAPLVIDNPEKSAIAALFAIEYSTLFDGLLPALVALELPLPLGGTSNHFRRSALEGVGGWDPFNVTEDADLGIRITRFGYRIGTLRLPTLEEAPVTLGPWLRQRTRWLKGWMHTWLVHMRHPVLLWRDLGTRRMLGFQALGLGMIASALAHPIFLATPFLLLLDPSRLWNDGDLVIAVLAGLSIFNLAAGYAAMVMLAARTLPLRGRSWLTGFLWLLPLYWLLMTVACVLAIVEFVFRPHRWNKTPHVGRPLRNRAMAGIAAQDPSPPHRQTAEAPRIRRA